MMLPEPLQSWTESWRSATLQSIERPSTLNRTRQVRSSMRTTALAVGILLLATVAVGCAGDRQQQASADAADGGYTAPASIYSVMDPTSLVYTDVAAGAAANDNPWRWAGFILHPAGVAIDYGVNRPIYTLTSKMPYLFGYTAEDSMKDSQRR